MTLKPETALREVPGIGTTRLAQLGRIHLQTLSDVLLYAPLRYEDRRHPQDIAGAVAGQEMLARGKVVAHGVNRFRRGTKSVFEFVLDDGSGRLHCRYWNMAYLDSQFSVGDELFVFGKISGSKPTVMDHPEYELIQSEDTPLHLNRIVPIYRLTEGLPQRWMRALLWRVLGEVEVPESNDERLVCEQTGATRLECFHQLHFPDVPEETERARRHFALEELVSLQRGFARRRARFRARARGHPCAGDNHLIRPFLKRLPYQLTPAQTRVLREIRADLGKDSPMRRLLHGDVGSGKTVVAACAALMTIESGFSVAVMAPTEILAGQHFERFQQWLRPLDVPVELRTGKFKPVPSVKQPAVTIGTHALIHEGYQPDRLGLVVIDEQHRFGVVEREKLVRKGVYPHLLVMTATPIPRTLGLTVYGDLDISLLDEVPARRGTLRTYLRSAADLPGIWRFVREQLAAGRQAYVVYPRIDETGSKAELKSVSEEFDRLRELLSPHPVGLLHGRLESRAAAEIMEAFREKHLGALVATSVIEVGLDIPNASVMVIENAGQFGLSQLHQLRGRIGRGENESHCILVEDSRKADVVERLKVLLRSDDGFKIAEEDLRIRGVGDFLGTRQSGLPRLKFARLSTDRELVEQARRLVDEHPVNVAPQRVRVANRVTS